MQDQRDSGVTGKYAAETRLCSVLQVDRQQANLPATEVARADLAQQYLIE
jgi:hypothetical protein